MKKTIEEMRELYSRRDKAIDKKYSFRMFWACSVLIAIWTGIGGLFNLNIPLLIGCLICLLAAAGCQCAIKHYRKHEHELDSEIMRSDY